MVTSNKYQGFAERLNKKLDEAGAPGWDKGRQKWVANFFKHEFRISPIGVRKWMKAEGLPDMSRLEAVAVKLNTTVNYLMMGSEDNDKVPQPPYKADRKDIHILIDSLPPRLLTKARAALEFFVVEEPPVSQASKARKKA